jgi:hypothetical protein
MGMSKYEALSPELNRIKMSKSDPKILFFIKNPMLLSCKK